MSLVLVVVLQNEIARFCLGENTGKKVMSQGQYL